MNFGMCLRDQKEQKVHGISILKRATGSECFGVSWIHTNVKSLILFIYIYILNA